MFAKGATAEIVSRDGRSVVDEPEAKGVAETKRMLGVGVFVLSPLIG